MAKQTRKKTTSRKTASAGRKNTRAKRTARSQGRIGNFYLPFFLSFCILVCLAAMGFIGYRTVTASEFFDVANIEVRGTQRSSSDDIRRIIAAQTEQSGVWNADLPELRSRVERLPFVRSAAISRVLPNGIRVSVEERVPRAVVRIDGNDMLVDEEGNLLASADETESGLPFVMIGWDTTRSEKADADNIARVAAYQKMLEEWREFDLASRVSHVDLSSLREPRAVTADSGHQVTIAVGRENFGENLRRGINAIVGKGETFESVDLIGTNLQLGPRKTASK